ncbi:Uncharacterised protein [Bordetella pertussis]|nr:Uncharacterised protein [Bordetella pertussis]
MGQEKQQGADRPGGQQRVEHGPQNLRRVGDLRGDVDRIARACIGQQFTDASLGDRGQLRHVHAQPLGFVGQQHAYPARRGNDGQRAAAGALVYGQCIGDVEHVFDRMRAVHTELAQHGVEDLIGAHHRCRMRRRGGRADRR